MRVVLTPTPFDLVVTGLRVGKSQLLGNIRAVKLPAPKKISFGIYIVDTWVTSWHSNAIDYREVLSKVRVTVKKWGNSAAVRLPTSVMKATQLEVDEVVEVHEDGGRIVIEPVRPRRYELSELLKGITRKNQHREVDFGPAVGGEIW